MIILTPDNLREIFSEKILAAAWLEKHGNVFDQEVASVTRQTLEDVYTKMMAMNAENWQASSLTRETLDGVYALKIAA